MSFPLLPTFVYVCKIPVSRFQPEHDETEDVRVGEPFPPLSPTRQPELQTLCFCCFGVAALRPSPNLVHLVTPKYAQQLSV